ncbi:ABC transporter permease [Inconstantimicrobium mannanitabidum]|uniref:Sodium ABC transporter n=1 Tax=Inconstantimicrobium mannanitabidum TaxID=1604901 RepID=A0ACB5RIE4_9CLOT|nr:ABC transporter permease [Clostridium sp. TW13]GKX68635.1 sodium ABC transporter [Clostridium sp. TW13]
MNHFVTVLKKELIDILRDKKTIILGILLPILLYPLMTFGLSKLAESSMSTSNKTFTVTIKDEGKSSVRDLLNQQQQIKIKIKDFSDAEKSLKDGETSLIIEVPKAFDESVSKEQQAKIKLTYDDKSQDSSMLKSTVSNMLSEYSQQLAVKRLQAKNIDASILKPFNVENKNISEIKSGNDAQTGMVQGILMMLPSILVILILAPTMGIAVDLCAGEKERGTIEPLLSTAVSRISIVWAKIVALAIIGIITLSCTLAAMGISFKMMLNGSEIAFVNAKFLLPIGIVCLFLILTVGALQIALSIYARSIKEANSYLSGVYMVAMILSYVPFAFDAKSIAIKYFHIPIMNTVCLMKELMAGIFRLDHFVIVILWNMVYTALAVLFARYMFSKEEVVFRS